VKRVEGGKRKTGGWDWRRRMRRMAECNRRARKQPKKKLFCMRVGVVSGRKGRRQKKREEEERQKGRRKR
jgi:hypothetical protein